MKRIYEDNLMSDWLIVNNCATVTGKASLHLKHVTMEVNLERNVRWNVAFESGSDFRFPNFQRRAIVPFHSNESCPSQLPSVYQNTILYFTSSVKLPTVFHKPLVRNKTSINTNCRNEARSLHGREPTPSKIFIIIHYNHKTELYWSVSV